MTSVDVQPPSGSAVSQRLPPIAGNDWPSIAVPDILSWTPTMTVSVVVPAWNSQSTLALTLASLAAQSYPHDLLEVIVVDDGSEPPLRPEVEGLNVRVLRLEREAEFGSGRARRVGAASAHGEILVFLDSDMMLEPSALLAHARWHHAYGAAVTIGRRQHTHLKDISVLDVLSVSSDREFQELLGDHERWSVEYVERKLEATANLTVESDQVWRITSAGNLGVSRRFYEDVGEFPAFGMRGVEDTLFGYRCYNSGAVFVYDESASAWHDGRSFFQGEQADQARRTRQGKLNNYLPAYRRHLAGRSFVVPMLRVHVDQGCASAQAVEAAVNSVLASDMHDLQVSLALPDDDPATTSHLRDTFMGDSRVVVCPRPVPLDQGEAEGVAFQVLMRAPALLAPETLGSLLQHLEDGQLGAVHATVPGGAAGELVHLIRTRAYGRARRTSTHDQDPTIVIGELFGERWLPGSAFGIVAGSPDGLRPKRPSAASRKSSGSKPADGHSTSQDLDDLAEVLGHILSAKAPADSVIAIVTKGDDRLLVKTLGARRGGHFPQTPQGVWAGYHPRRQ